MIVWRKARKKPIVVEFREVERKIPIASDLVVNDIWGEEIKTIEGNTLFVEAKKNFIIRGIEGEIYPCMKDIFAKTYDIVEEESAERNQHDSSLSCKKALRERTWNVAKGGIV